MNATDLHRVSHFDTLRDRMQEPEPRSKWGRIVALFLTIFVVTWVVYLNKH